MVPVMVLLVQMDWAAEAAVTGIMLVITLALVGPELSSFAISLLLDAHVMNCFSWGPMEFGMTDNLM